ncbi:hypothetical protein AVEN_271258-1 [Araneus ventricosus]|uniref:Uncharacterized protein n=1 Tax=Araneus ventricosus TaxID=182803 RepID=A0A4Y2G342_ARAVE|nr:hypothetical protein AVEN_271258-1 [Araneus ventricosus]
MENDALFSNIPENTTHSLLVRIADNTPKRDSEDGRSPKTIRVDQNFPKSLTTAEQRNLQSRGRTSRLLARNLRVHFHRHHGEGFSESRQMEEEIQKEEEEESTDF